MRDESKVLLSKGLGNKVVLMEYQLKPGHLGKVGVRSQNSEATNSLDS
jgi:hypothetical protein